MNWNLDAALQSRLLIFLYCFAICGLLPSFLPNFYFAAEI